MARNGKTGRRYLAEEKAAAVRMVRTLGAGFGADRGTAQRVALPLGYGVESVSSWVRQADIDDGVRGGVTPNGVAEIQRLEQENRELRRANETLLYGRTRAINFCHPRVFTLKPSRLIPKRLWRALESDRGSMHLVTPQRFVCAYSREVERITPIPRSLPGAI